MPTPDHIPSARDFGSWLVQTLAALAAQGT